MIFDTIYLDYNATTPLHPRVREAMQKVLGRGFGNPSSPHSPGRQARRVLETARKRLANYLGVEPDEITFTSGGTESNNLLVRGITDPQEAFWTTAVEHPSLLGPARHRWDGGFPGGIWPVAADGCLDAGAVGESAALRDAWVSIQWVNNETGVVQDLRAWVDRLHARGALVHTDGAQGFFRLPGTLPELGVDAATISAHKSFGPMGVGVLYLRRGLVLDPPVRGGSQERGVRPGTENVVAIHGMGVLAQIAGEEDLWPRTALERKNRLLREVLAEAPDVRIITPAERSFPNTLSVTFPGVHAETLLVRLDADGIAASSGSACSSGTGEPSSVLRAMALSDREIRGAMRISFGPQTTDEALEHGARRVVRHVQALREGRP